MVNVACKGKYIMKVQGHDQVITKEGDVNLPEAEYPKYTWGQLKTKLSHWPKFTPDGFNPNEKKAFKDGDTLLNSGIRTDPIKMLRYVVRWDVDPNQPAPAPTPAAQDTIASSASSSASNTSGIVYRTGANYSGPSAPSASASHVRQTSSGAPAPNLKDIGVEVRMFADGGIINITVSGKGHQFSGSAEIAVPEEHYSNYTWGALKRRLGATWPKLADGGHTTGVEKRFSDGDALIDTGIAPGKGGKAVAVQVVFSEA